MRQTNEGKKIATHFETIVKDCEATPVKSSARRNSILTERVEVFIADAKTNNGALYTPHLNSVQKTSGSC